MLRLIEEGYPYRRLWEQFRMNSEIARLVLDIYPDLQTAPNTSTKLPLSLAHRVYWWDSGDGTGETAALSPLNETEAEMVAAVTLLLRLELSKDQITILTGYQGQVTTISKHNLSGVRVRTIDSYQGNENDVIILSLVRDNERRNIGFMKAPGRRCVALSRARQSLLIVGSRSTFEEGDQNKEWGRVVEYLAGRGLIGRSLPIRMSGDVRQVESVGELREVLFEFQKSGWEKTDRCVELCLR